MDIQQSLSTLLPDLLGKKILKTELEHLEEIIQEEHFSELYDRSLSLYVCFLGAKFHQTVVPTLFTICVGLLLVRQAKLPLLEKQLMKTFHELVAFEKGKVEIARSFKNLVEVHDEILKCLETNDSSYVKMFTVVLLLMPQSDQLLIDELLDLAVNLEEQRRLIQVKEYLHLVEHDKKTSPHLFGSIVVQKRMNELKILANFGRRNLPNKEQTVKQSVVFFGMIPYYEKLLKDSGVEVTNRWSVILDYFEDFPKSKIRVEYLSLLGNLIGWS